jgi:transposase
MIDIHTRKVVDILPSRELDDVAQWLSEFPNLKYISRDGSRTYKAAIENSHPQAQQISDRFHIVKNLTEAITKYFQKIFNGRFEIPITRETKTQKEQFLNSQVNDKKEQVKQLYKLGKSIVEIRMLTGCAQRTIKGYLKAITAGKETKPTVRAIEHNNAIKKIEERMDKVKQLYAQGYSVTAISKVTGYTWATTKKYLETTSVPIHGQYGVSRPGKLSPYRQEVKKLRSQNMTYQAIYEIIKEKGYTGSVAALRGYMTKEMRLEKDFQSRSTKSGEIEMIEKKWVIKWLYKPLEKVSVISSEQFVAVSKEYPIFRTLYDLLREFKELMFSKKAEELEAWMKKAESYEVEELTSVVNGLRQDIEAVKNGITLEYNNGLAEGTVNKIKLVKRIMYGRCTFPTLKSKVLQLEYL